MTPFTRGEADCVQDSFENAPFSSTGGLDNRDNMMAPDYIEYADKREYLIGYSHQAELLYGPDWKTCKFSWQPALTINKKEE